ncbi:rna-directed dna polymerase from mobile element jockey-like [Willisornis vidua]|uniref:Rna-directed dna polymerase from mobile element jockey-like n=1 Tax=Willisornis vidua TaxID=1566151 RepID=A0ABQ9DP25_9PASS|nr:rna-directed dna polymerase from mobile element jockey-like [Willisornis vidua]
MAKQDVPLQPIEVQDRAEIHPHSMEDPTLEQGSVLDLAPSGKSGDDTKLCGAVNMSEGRDAIQMDFERLERWAPKNLMKFGKTKGKVVHKGRGKPKIKYRMGRKWIESSPFRGSLRGVG